MEPYSFDSWGNVWQDVIMNLSRSNKDKSISLGDTDCVSRGGDFEVMFSPKDCLEEHGEGPDKDDLELLNLLKGYLAKYLEQFFENPDDVVREVLKARDEEIKRLENKIKELEEKIDSLLLRIPTPLETGTPSRSDDWPWRWKPYDISPTYPTPGTSNPLDPITFRTWVGGTLGEGTTSTSV